MKTIFKTIKTVSRNPVLIIGIGIVFFIAYHQLNAHAETVSFVNTKDRSVSFADGKYRVDTSFIRNDLSKTKLISELEKQTLEQKKTIGEIPSFIRNFLDSISYDRKFDIVNPGEDWKAGITNYGHVIFKKVYDPDKKDSVTVLSGDGAILPNKQLVYFGMSDNIALMSYLQGGVGPHPNILIFKYKNNRVTDFWYGSTFIDEKFSTKSEILKSLKSKRKNGC